MSLISCPECDHKVSDRASACPSCGYPMRRHDVVEQVTDGWDKAAAMLGSAWEQPRVRSALSIVALVALLMFIVD